MAGPQCCVPAPPSEHACAGAVDLFGPLNAYTVAPPSPKAAVILVSDILGFDAPLLRKLADKIAGRGYFVLVPDYYNGDPFVPAEGPDGFAAVDDWLKNHKPLDSVKPTEEIVKVLNSKGFSSVGAVGFCWGAKVLVEVAKGHLLKAAILAHPAWVVEQDIQDVKTPIAIFGAEMDHTAPPPLVEKFAEILKSKPEVESFVHIFPGVAHGWTTRYDTADEKAVERASESHDKMLEWFGKFLH